MARAQNLEERRKPSEDLFKWFAFEDLKKKRAENDSLQPNCPEEEEDSGSNLDEFESFEGEDEPDEDMVDSHMQLQEEQVLLPEQTQEENSSAHRFMGVGLRDRESPAPELRASV